MTFVPRMILLNAAIVAFWSLPARVQAEPIHLTAGFLSSAGLDQSGRFDFSGQGFRIIGVTEQGSVRPTVCSPCTAGETISLSSNFVTGLQLSAPIIIDGATSTSFADAASSFTASSFTVPSVPHDFTMQGFFTFTGLLIGLDASEDRLFQRELIGQGRLTANFTFNPGVGGAAFDFADIRYDFTEQDPVPEPMTLLLVGSGLAGIAARRWTPGLRRSGR